jgi:hypothetical protein
MTWRSPTGDAAGLRCDRRVGSQIEGKMVPDVLRLPYDMSQARRCGIKKAMSLRDGKGLDTDAGFTNDVRLLRIS